MEAKQSEKSSEKTFDCNNNSKEMKVCFLGDTHVGKTSIINRYIKNSFEDILPRTLGGTNHMAEVVYLDHRFKYWLWDLAGYESFRNIVPSYFRGASVFILVYDCTNETSFESIDHWHALTQKYAGSMLNTNDLIFFLVGNKTDKRNEKVVTTKNGEERAKSLKCIFHETSALSGEGVTTLFDKLGQKTLQIERRKAAATARNETRSDNGRQTPVEGRTLSNERQQQQQYANNQYRCSC